MRSIRNKFGAAKESKYKRKLIINEGNLIAV